MAWLLAVPYGLIGSLSLYILPGEARRTRHRWPFGDAILGINKSGLGVYIPRALYENPHLHFRLIFTLTALPNPNSLDGGPDHLKRGVPKGHKRSASAHPVLKARHRRHPCLNRGVEVGPCRWIGICRCQMTWELRL